ncbi:MAG: hypothetical protein Q9221_007343 [Calogaya cf. arnoldii]
MDPASIVGLTQSVVSIVDIIAKNIHALSTLQAKYSNADLSVNSLLTQLSSLKAALGQIAEWIKFEGLKARFDRLQLGEDLVVALNGCQLLISILEERLDQLAHRKGSDKLRVKGKIAFLWEEHELNLYLTHLSNQVIALNLLLSAIQCRSLSEERTLLQSSEIRDVIQRLRDDTSSLLWLRDSESILSRKTVSTCNSDLLETVFDFDREVLNSRAYHAATRFNMKQAISHKSLGQSKPGETASLNMTTAASIEAEEASADTDTDTDTVKAKSMSDAPPSPETIHQVVGPNAHRKVTRWSRLLEQMLSSKKSQLRTGDEAITSTGMPLEQDVLPWKGKILVLGTGESGKTTLIKSLKRHIEGPYTLEQRSSCKGILFSNAVNSMREVLEAMECDEIPLADEANLTYHKQTIFIQPLSMISEKLPSGVADAIEALYHDPGFQEFFKRGNEYRFYDFYEGAEYYWRSIPRFNSLSYVPTDEDILWYRVKTEGVRRHPFNPPRHMLDVFDVGGTWYERRRWIEAFENVDAILFTVDIGCWDETLFDGTTNRMRDALEVFHSIVNSKWFVRTTIALIFTKYDKLRTKLAAGPLKAYFADLEADNNVEEAGAYITHKFLSLNETQKHVEVHYTSIVDEPWRLGETAMDILQRVRHDSLGREFPADSLSSGITHSRVSV